MKGIEEFLEQVRQLNQPGSAFEKVISELDRHVAMACGSQLQTAIEQLDAQSGFLWRALEPYGRYREEMERIVGAVNSQRLLGPGEELQRAIKQLEGQSEVVRQVLEPYGRYREEMERMVAAISSQYLLGAGGELQQTIRQLEAQSEFVRQALEPYGSYREHIERIAKSVKLEELLAGSLLRPWGALDSTEELLAYVNSYTANVVATVAEFAEDGPLDAADPRLRRCLDYVAGLLALAPKSLPIAKYLMSILLPLVIAVWNHSQSEEARREVSDRLSAIETRLLSRPDEIRDGGLDHPEFIVHTAVNLRNGPSEESEKITVLRRGTTVAALEINGPWAKVGVFDLRDGVVKEGWVYTKYIMLVGPVDGD